MVPEEPARSGAPDFYMEMARESVDLPACSLSRARAARRVLRYLLDSNEFLSPYGIRSLSRIHRERPFVHARGMRGAGAWITARRIEHPLFGGNSNCGTGMVPVIIC